MEDITITYEDLNEAIDIACLDARIRTYSGRDMEGVECAAVVVDGGIADIALFFVALVDAIDDDPARYLAKRTKTDQMGHETVVYWPGITLVGEPRDPDDPDDDDDDDDDDV